MQQQTTTNKTNPLWHNRPVEAVLEELGATPSGLDMREAEARLETYGANHLPAPHKHGAFMRFLLQFHNILIYVLLAAAAITAFLDHLIDTVVILAVVVINAFIGFIQEGKAEKAMDAIRQMLAPHASVLRSGERRSVMGETLVPGDIVLLEAGDKVAADLRLLQANGLQIQEAILTGESVPVEKQAKPVKADVPLGDRSCMAFSGTLVTSGQGTGVVVATGGDTEIGHISNLLSEVETLTTPLVKQMSVFARWLTAVIIVMAVLLVAIGYFVEHHDFADMFMAVVGLSVAAIPEGLPAVLTITLAIGVQAMARRNAIVRRLPAIETLGSVSVICTDKTGTLTRNEMMVASVATPEHLFTLEGNGYEPEGVILLNDKEVDGHDHTILDELARASLLCNDASLQQRDGVWIVEGDPMEGALLAFAGKVGMDVRKEISNWTRTDSIPFNAKHRFMATLNHDHENHAFIFVKGAPEQVMAMCDSQRSSSGDTETLDKDYWDKRADAIASEGQRVLALAIKPVQPEHTVLEKEHVEGSLTLLGLVGLIDPPRPEAIEAVAECHGAGIRVKMITGDHAGTAAAIGRQIGLKNPDRVLTGAELDRMEDDELAEAVLDTDIFARTSPEHKLRLVMALQAHGVTVAMTGDGVNDAPALKRADAGIAMGKKGSEAAKEASELVLADDNFASIAAAVREGRAVYDNLKKVIAFMLPINGGESISLILALLLGLTLPIAPTQILWINMIGSAVLGMTLAFEPAEPQVMRRPPRPVNAPLLSSFVVWRIVFVSILFAAGIFGQFKLAILMGKDLETARTIAVNTLVAMEVFYLFSIRYGYEPSLSWKGVMGTPPVLIALAIVTVAQLLLIYAPPLQMALGTSALTFMECVIAVSTGVAVFILIEIEKKIRLGLTS